MTYSKFNPLKNDFKRSFCELCFYILNISCLTDRPTWEYLNRRNYCRGAVFYRVFKIANGIAEYASNLNIQCVG